MTNEKNYVVIGKPISVTLWKWKTVCSRLPAAQGSSEQTCYGPTNLYNSNILDRFLKPFRVSWPVFETFQSFLAGFGNLLEGSRTCFFMFSSTRFSGFFIFCFFSICMLFENFVKFKKCFCFHILFTN